VRQRDRCAAGRRHGRPRLSWTFTRGGEILTLEAGNRPLGRTLGADDVTLLALGNDPEGIRRVRVGGEISVSCRERAGEPGQRKTSTILQDSPPTSEALSRRPAQFVLRPVALRQQCAGANRFLSASAENYYNLVGTSGEFRFDIPAL